MKKASAFLFAALLLAIIAAANTDSIPSFLRDMYRFPGGDLLGHFALYGIFALLLFRAYPNSRRLALALLLFIAAEEASQILFAARTPSLLDFAFSLLGVLLGWGLARLTPNG
jgi:VanZ family protein